MKLVKENLKRPTLIKEEKENGKENDCGCVFCDAVKQDEISRKAMTDVMKERSKDVPHQGATSDIKDAIKKSGVTKEIMKKDIVEGFLKEAYDFVENGSAFTVNVKSRAELGKLVEFLKENRVKHNIKRSVVEGFRYTVSIGNPKQVKINEGKELHIDNIKTVDELNKSSDEVIKRLYDEITLGQGAELEDRNSYIKYIKDYCEDDGTPLKEGKEPNFDVDAFIKKFNDNYDFLYNAEGEVAGEREALDYFDNEFLPKTEDENSKEFKILKAFNTKRDDFISSDREAAAFAFTLEDFGLLDESCKKSHKRKIKEGIKLKEKVSDEAYEVAEIIENNFNGSGKHIIERDDFDEQLALAIRKVFGIDNVWEIVDDNGVANINGKEIDMQDFETDIRGILGMNGWETIYEGEHEEKPLDIPQEEHKEEPIEEELKLLTDIGSYEPWSGAVDLWNEIVDADKVEELEFALEDIYPDGLTVTQLNDILWFEQDWVREMLGLVNVENDED